MRRLLALLVIFTAACETERPIVDALPATQAPAGENSVPDTMLGRALDTTRPEYVSDEPIDYLRLQLKLAADGMQLSAAERVRSQIRPTPYAEPQYMLVARAGDQIVSAEALQFPTERHTLYEPGMAHERIALTESTTLVYLELKPAIDRLTVERPDGSSALEIPRDQLQRALGSGTGGGGGESSLDAMFPHIRFYHRGEEKMLLASDLEGAAIIDPDEKLVGDVTDLLRSLTPGLLSAVQGVVLVNAPKSKAAGWAAGSTMYLNYSRYVPSKWVIRHEATHILGDLLSKTPPPLDTNGRKGFAPEIIMWAAGERTRLRIVKGLEAVYGDLHQVGIAAREFNPYFEAEIDENKFNPPKPPADMGVATEYGLSFVYEDLAEMVAAVESSARSDICSSLDGKTSKDVGASLIAGKILLAAAAGALSDGAAHACLARSEVIPTSEGIDFIEAGGSHIEFDSARLQVGARELSIESDGPKGYSARIVLKAPADNESFLGMHRLANTVTNKDPSEFAALFNSDPKELATRGSARGTAFVIQQDAEQTVIIVHGLYMQNYTGQITDIFPVVNIKARGAGK